MALQGHADRRPIELEAGWQYMEDGITKLKHILEGDKPEAFTAEHYMMLYTTIYNMCTQKPPHDHSEQLYARYTEAFQVYIQEKVLPSLRDHHDEHLLKQLKQRWDNHKIMVRWLSRFFNYLDRYYIQRHNLHPLNDVGLLVFRDHVYAEIKRASRDAMLKLVEAEREGEQIDRSLLKNVLAIFQEVGMGLMECYERDFEEAMLKDTAEYYRRRAAVWIQEDSSPDYLVKAEECLRDEEERVNSYFHVSTKPKLLKEAENELLKVHQMQLLEKEHSGCAALLRDDKKADLGRMYRMFNRLPKGLEPMAEIFRKHVEEEGMKLVREATEAAESKKEKEREAGDSPENAFIRGVIALHDKYMEYVQDSFGNSSLFHKALKEAFESFCNKQVSGASVAELMASFCDNLLKKVGGEGACCSCRCCCCVWGRRCCRCCRCCRAAPLACSLSLAQAAPARGPSRTTPPLHPQHAFPFFRIRSNQSCLSIPILQMEGMVNDLQLAKEREKAFEEWRERKGFAGGMEMNVTVLTTGFWPTYKGVEQYTSYFDETTSKTRRLSWQFTNGTVHVKATYDKNYELILMPLQAAVLLPFNDSDSLSYGELKEATKLPDEDLTRCLASLTLSKYKLLAKEAASKGIGPADSFRINPKFTDRMRRIRVPLPPVDDRKKVQEDVDKDRKHAIEAAIVRIMKSRKALKHQQLLVEVVQQLQRMFTPDVKVIKRAIDSLIERDYLERDANDQQLYKYLA
ncbi:hypothetical protein CHLNCDRAFT_22706 [Chlorella variabilis]|uniref:Cullin family profile domain-containing protein n=1 Tax=Chlorella variabilis TaxID=554065 RepID=E1ZDU4_CHLVA|nr:hypothetical protein CHLNCDRAFT_22706 [Chlorella variabilis]EFN56087.1 hypothetical protein CHLNCDRAFT_22706 [Chlorella variabilis]|eukprot:XP_005848189.1 hypothetical protein CHLNCDRAFT_22706 [Chlorella variabilis]